METVATIVKVARDKMAGVVETAETVADIAKCVSLWAQCSRVSQLLPGVYRWCRRLLAVAHVYQDCIRSLMLC